MQKHFYTRRAPSATFAFDFETLINTNFVKYSVVRRMAEAKYGKDFHRGSDDVEALNETVEKWNKN